jgi:hypothetical protein
MNNLRYDLSLWLLELWKDLSVCRIHSIGRRSIGAGEDDDLLVVTTREEHPAGGRDEEGFFLLGEILYFQFMRTPKKVERYLFCSSSYILCSKCEVCEEIIISSHHHTTRHHHHHHTQSSKFKKFPEEIRARR